MKLLRLAPENTKISFMRFRRVSYPLSAVLSIFAVVLFLSVGMNYGIDFAGGVASQPVAIQGCDNPVSYAVTAKVAFGDGREISVGPFSQIASAGITAGLPGGLTLSWDPSVRQLFVRPAASTCKGVY